MRKLFRTVAVKALLLQGLLVPFTQSHAFALSPTDSKMILLTDKGARWGGTEAAFAPKSFSVHCNLGNVIWRDSDPDHVTMVNPENKSFMIQTLKEYADDEVSHKLLEESPPKPAKLSDGTAALQTLFARRRSNGELEPFQRTVAIPSVKLSPAMTKAWCYIMNCPPTQGFVVELYQLKGYHRSPGTTSMMEADIQSVMGKEAISHWVSFLIYDSLKVVALEKSRFEIPKNYKQAQDSAAFFLSSDGRSLKNTDIEDLFRAPTK